jgi:hypothetical protein
MILATLLLLIMMEVSPIAVVISINSMSRVPRS